MDEYLRTRYKKTAVDSVQPTRPRYRPTQPAKPMFPVNPTAGAPAEPMFPVYPKSSSPESIAESKTHPVRRHAPAATRQARPKRRLKFVKYFVILLVLVLGAGGGYYLKYLKAATPLPRQLVESAGFPIYYPTKIPSGYKYQPDSLSNQKGLINYKLADGSNSAIVSQQIRTSKNFDPTGLPNFKTIQVSGGAAVIGLTNGLTTVIYLTPTTLINIIGLNNISRGDIILIAQNLSVVKKPAKLL